MAVARPEGACPSGSLPWSLSDSINTRWSLQQSADHHGQLPSRVQQSGEPDPAWTQIEYREHYLVTKVHLASKYGPSPPGTDVLPASKNGPAILTAGSSEVSAF